jgi:hypothetical protein
MLSVAAMRKSAFDLIGKPFPAALRQLAQPSDNIVPLVFGHEPKSTTMAVIQPL